MGKFLPKYILILCIFIFAGSASALPSDRDQPLHISADNGTLAKNQGVSVVRGHVVMTQGTSVLNADTVTLYTDNHNQLLKAVATGHPAVYSTVTDVKKPPFVASALTIEYQPPAAMIILTGDAKATQGPNSYAAPTIIYHIDKQTVVSPPSMGGRTTIIIQPQSLQKSQFQSQSDS